MSNLNGNDPIERVRLEGVVIIASIGMLLVLSLVGNIVQHRENKELQTQIRDLHADKMELRSELYRIDRAELLAELQRQGVEITAPSNLTPSNVLVNVQPPAPKPVVCAISNRSTDSLILGWRAEGPRWVLNITPEIRAQLKGTSPSCFKPRP